MPCDFAFDKHKCKILHLLENGQHICNTIFNVMTMLILLKTFLAETLGSGFYVWLLS